MSAARRISLVLSLVALGACAGHAPRPTASSAAAQHRDAGPLAARLLPPFHRNLNFVLSEPAYVTIFEIVPGRGVSVVYPAPFDVGADEPLGPGSHSVFAVPVNVGRWFYSNMPVAGPSPTYLYMIASREPLAIGEVLENPAELRRMVGFVNFTQFNEQRTMDILDARFVPRYLDDDAWASDWIALWPEPALDHPPVGALLPFPGCDQGSAAVAVPGSSTIFLCAPRATRQPPIEPPPIQPPPTDSSAKPPTKPQTEAKPTSPPVNGKRPNAPRQTRAEPMTLTVDYGAPVTIASDERRPSRERAAHRYERPWDRGQRASSLDRGGYPTRVRDGYDGRSARAGSASEGLATRAAGSSASRAERPEAASPRVEPRSEPAPAAAPRSNTGGQ